MIPENIRDEFPGLKDRIFLDAACVSVPPRPAMEAVRRVTEMLEGTGCASATQSHIDLDNLRNTARVEAARLIQARPDEIALVESTTHGLNLAAEAIPLQRGDHVVLCDLEFLEVAIPWVQKRQALGIEIDVVKNRSGAVLVEDIERILAPRTRVVTISSVQWASGFRCDLAALSDLCRSRGIFLVVDAIQQLGAVPIDVSQTPIDYLACGGHKWLNSPFGAGFLYVRRETMPHVRLPLAGYLNVQVEGWDTYFQNPTIVPVRDYSFADEARRWEIGGTSNYIGAAALAASLHMINDLGSSNISAHVHALADHLVESLPGLGTSLVTDFPRAQRAGIVSFSIGSADDNLDLMRHLEQNSVMVSVRYTAGVGGVRVSCHLYNSRADLDRLLSLVGDFMRKRVAVQVPGDQAKR